MPAPTTDLLYMPSIDANYIRQFDATVMKATRDYVVLDRTAFYPKGGGQPTDRGTLRWTDGDEARTAQVVQVVKKGIIKHTLAVGDASELPATGTEVEGRLDWDRRYRHMRMHTAQHLLSGIVFAHCGAATVGNQIHADRSRIDFAPAAFSDDDLAVIAARCNRFVADGAAVHIFEEAREEYEARDEAERLNLSLLPKSVTRLRVVAIEGVDAVPCAGTHVRATDELGELTILKRESKGKEAERITYTLQKP